MKGNDGSGDIEDRDNWRTPHWLFSELDRQYNFFFDCCATEENTLAPFYSNDFKDVEELVHKAWMNPPFSKAREMFEHFFEVVKRGVAIYRCDNLETKLWQNVILENCEWVSIIEGRIDYVGLTGSGSRFGSALIGVGVEAPKYIECSNLKVIK